MEEVALVFETKIRKINGLETDIVEMTKIAFRNRERQLN